jgi:hypothetical protein
MFNSYVKLPEGNLPVFFGFPVIQVWRLARKLQFLGWVLLQEAPWHGLVLENTWGNQKFDDFLSKCSSTHMGFSSYQTIPHYILIEVLRRVSHMFWFNSWETNHPGKPSFISLDDIYIYIIIIWYEIYMIWYIYIYDFTEVWPIPSGFIFRETAVAGRP